MDGRFETSGRRAVVGPTVNNGSEVVGRETRALLWPPAASEPAGTTHSPLSLPLIKAPNSAWEPSVLFDNFGMHSKSAELIDH